jgi:hypothetical protein
LLVGEIAPSKLVSVNPDQHLVQVTKFALNDLELQASQGTMPNALAVWRIFRIARLKMADTLERVVFKYLAISFQLPAPEMKRLMTSLSRGAGKVRKVSFSVVGQRFNEREALWR